MANRIIAERAVGLGGFAQARAKPSGYQYLPEVFTHVYIKLDFKPQYENARTGDDAGGFLRSVARAGMAAHRIAESYGGALMEVQGSLLHAALPPTFAGINAGTAFAGDLHRAYSHVFDDRTSRVDGWRMTLDTGKTLVVAGAGVHGDESLVSLGSAANRPAKYLHQQLELPEEARDLKRFHLGARNGSTGQWQTTALDRLPVGRARETDAVAEEVRREKVSVNYSDFRAVSGEALGQAAPIGNPTADRPTVYFGWVMRADLDGFTKRVEECLNDDAKLRDLASEFYAIMNEAVQFTHLHGENLVQLPWAGDNFTAAAVFSTIAGYEKAAPRRLIELSLDFEKEMNETATSSGFGGWAHGVAGGEVHGNSRGNVFIGSVEVRGRRFLVGAGEGFGRSAQAFGDINPKAGELVLYEPDWKRLDDSYRKVFSERAVTGSGKQSSLFRSARVDALRRVRREAMARDVSTPVSFSPTRTQQVTTKPYYR